MRSISTTASSRWTAWSRRSATAARCLLPDAARGGCSGAGGRGESVHSGFSALCRRRPHPAGDRAGPELRIACTTSFPGCPIDPQFYEFTATTPDAYETEIAGGRTFVDFGDLQQLLAMGLVNGGASTRPRSSTTARSSARRRCVTRTRSSATRFSISSETFTSPRRITGIDHRNQAGASEKCRACRDAAERDHGCKQCLTNKGTRER